MSFISVFDHHVTYIFDKRQRIAHACTYKTCCLLYDYPSVRLPVVYYFEIHRLPVVFTVFIQPFFAHEISPTFSFCTSHDRKIMKSTMTMLRLSKID